MLRTLRFLTGALLILAGSASLAQTPGSEVFPLKKGSKWVYKVADQEVTVEVVGTEKVDNVDYVKVETKVGGQSKATELYQVAADGIYRFRVKDDKIEPKVKIINLPAKKGDSWKIDSKVGTQTVKGEFKVTEDKAKVKIGMADAEAFLVEGDFDIAGTKTSVKQWFVPGKGIAKLTYKLGDSESTLELKEYTEGK